MRSTYLTDGLSPPERMFMDSTMYSRNSAESAFDSAPTDAGIVQAMNSDGLPVWILVPHIAAALLIWAEIAVTPTGMWNAVKSTAFAAMGPAPSAIAITAGVCGLLSLGSVWWCCRRGSQEWIQRVRTEAASRGADEQTRRADAA